MLSSRRSLSDLSRVNDPFVKMSATRLLGVNESHLDHWVKVDLVRQPIKCHSVGAGHVSQCRTPAFHNQLDHCFIVLKVVQESCMARLFDVRRHMIDLLQHQSLRRQLFLFRSSFFLGFSHASRDKFPCAETIDRHELPRNQGCKKINEQVPQVQSKNTIHS